MHCQYCQCRKANLFRAHRKNFLAPKTWTRKSSAALDIPHRLESLYRHIREIKDMIENKLANDVTLQSAKKATKAPEIPAEELEPKPQPQPLVLTIGDYVLYDAKDKYDCFCMETDEESTHQFCGCAI